MTDLPKRMIEDMLRASPPPGTQEAYVRVVTAQARR